MATKINNVPRLAIDDSVGARSQDQIIQRVLRPLIDYFEAFPQRYATQARPTAGEAQAGNIIRVLDKGGSEMLQCCLQRSTGDYEWVILGVASK